MQPYHYIRLPYKVPFKKSLIKIPLTSYRQKIILFILVCFGKVDLNRDRFNRLKPFQNNSFSLSSHFIGPIIVCQANLSLKGICKLYKVSHRPDGNTSDIYFEVPMTHKHHPQICINVYLKITIEVTIYFDFILPKFGTDFPLIGFPV